MERPNIGKGSEWSQWRRGRARIRGWLLSHNQWGDDGPSGPPNNGIGLTIPVEETFRCGCIQMHEIFAYFLNDAFEIWIGETYTDGDAKDESWRFNC